MNHGAGRGRLDKVEPTNSVVGQAIASNSNRKCRVCQMCQRFKIPIFSVKFPLITSGYLYIDQKIQIFLIFGSPPKQFFIYSMGH